MKWIAALAAVLLWCGSLGVGLSQPPGQPAEVVWNRFETPNFEVLSINKEQGEKLYRNLEQMRRWLYGRWAFKEGPFSVKCKVLLCPDQAVYATLFKRDKQAVQVERDAGGRTKSLAIWCYAGDRWYTSTVPSLLTEVVLCEFEATYGVRFPLWLHRGMATLNSSVPDMRERIGVLKQIYDQNLPCFWTEDILRMTPDKLAKYQPQNQLWFDRECAAFCLYLMKTHGQKKFLLFLDSSTNNRQPNISLLGYASYQDFDKAFNRYMYNVSADISNGRTPNSYFTWDSW